MWNLSLLGPEVSKQAVNLSSGTHNKLRSQHHLQWSQESDVSKGVQTRRVELAAIELRVSLFDFFFICFSFGGYLFSPGVSPLSWGFPLVYGLG